MEGRTVEERISRRRFIRLGTVLGVGAAGTSLLAACGGGGGEGQSGAGGGSPEKKPPETTSAPSDGSSGSGRAGGQGIAAESDVRPGSAVEFKDGGEPAVLVRLDSGDFVAYSAVCTHQGCTVKYRDGELACPCHGSVFDPANGGAVVSGPANRPLPEIPVELRGGEVYKA